MSKVIRTKCTASNNRGDQCQRTAIAGGSVCRYHGGAAPHVQRKAEARLILMEASEQASEVLIQEMNDDTISSSDRQKAANSILDRAGVARIQELSGQSARDILKEKLMDMMGPSVVDAEQPEEIENGSDRVSSQET